MKEFTNIKFIILPFLEGCSLARGDEKLLYYGSLSGFKFATPTERNSQKCNSSQAKENGGNSIRVC
jgi:hypothetical protein